MPDENVREEYKDLSDNMRHYANMRFAQLTLYFALSAGLFTVVFTSDPPLPDVLRLILKIVGVVAAGAFALMEERAGDYWNHFRERACVLEPLLGYRQYANRPAVWCLGATATNAARLLLWGGGVLWLLSLYFGP
jgi:hypothetical protein